jgi:hypothetical protein
MNSSETRETLCFTVRITRPSRTDAGRGNYNDGEDALLFTLK